ncbi:MAG: cytochrome-c peroxidase [Flavitalea sp.]
MHRKEWLIYIVLITGFIACNKDDIDRFTGFENPSNFPPAAYHFNTNEVTKSGFELGRKLFYDPVLSSNNMISCGSCHIPTSAFTHHGHSLSHGIFDRLGTRNSPPIMNLAWNTSFMWDGGVFDLDLQPIAPITNHVEMGESVANVLEKLRNNPVYPALFKKAFNSEEITTSVFLKALSQFMVMCISSNAKYDQVMRKEADFTADEQSGYAIFKEKCSSCHKEPLFTDYSFRNNGLSISMADDKGRYLVTLKDTDVYKFKVPSLRNLDYTPPYMHDGLLLTLNAVLDHYTEKVQRTPNLDPLLQLNNSPGIALTPDEKLKILTFLQTLNDPSFVTDRRFAEQ